MNLANLLKLMSVGLESLLTADLGHVGGYRPKISRFLQGYQNDWLNEGLTPGLKSKTTIEFTLEQHKTLNNTDFNVNGRIS